jgi:phenylacetate-CoA ligase
VEFEGDESLIPKLERDFKEFLGFKPKLVALPFGTLERFDGKAKRLVKS